VSGPAERAADLLVHYEAEVRTIIDLIVDAAGSET